MNELDELRDAIHALHGGEATHRESVPVKETLNGKTVWEGVVEVFHLAGHARTDTVYAWFHDPCKSGKAFHPVTVPHSPSPNACSGSPGLHRSGVSQCRSPSLRRWVAHYRKATQRLESCAFESRQTNSRNSTRRQKAKGQTFSEFIRSTLNAVIEAEA